MNHYMILYSFIFTSMLYSASCYKEKEQDNTRTFRMGFMNSAPRIDFDLTIQTLNIWAQRADAAIISTELPWDSLLTGTSPVEYIDRNYKGLVEFYHYNNFELWVYIDPVNGLNRAIDADMLVAKKKSISQSEIQKIYRRFVVVMDSVLKPEHLGLALETNLIRGVAPDSIYQGIKKAVNDVAIEIKTIDKNVKLSVSVQVEYAWGKLSAEPYKGIEQDFSDFPFIDELGLSSYPYLVFDNPGDIPSNYYSELIETNNIPVFVSEGGWSSATVTNFTGSLQKQSDYIIKNSVLLNNVNGIAYFQLVFTDIDLENFMSDLPPNLYLFANLGLVDINLAPKPALSAWDNIFSKRPSINN